MRLRSELKPYQADMVGRALASKRVAIWAEVGLGKTAIALSVIADLKLPTLVVAPKAVAEASWDSEALMWEHTKHLRFSKILGTPKQREKALEADADVWLINYENLNWLVDLYDEPPFKVVVFDESDSLKDPSAKRTKAAARWAPYVTYMLQLTGTPAPQNYIDLFSQVWLLDLGERFGKSVTAFKSKYFMPDKVNRQQPWQVYTWKLKNGAKDQIEEAVKDIAFSLRQADYLQLPDMVPVEHNLVMTEALKSKYKELKEDAVVHLNGAQVTAVSAGVLSSKLLQFTSGSVYDENRTAHHVHDMKLDLLERIWEENNRQPLLVWYAFETERDRVLERFGKNARTYDGPETLAAWNRKEIGILVAHPASVGAGINLQHGGHVMVWFTIPFNSRHYTQGIGRMQRQGQVMPVMVHHLMIKGTADQHALDVVRGKVTLQDGLMAALTL